MFPASWDPTHAVKKRRRTFVEESEEHAEQALPQVPFTSDLQQTILRRLNAPDQPASQPAVRLDHILSRVPYRSMLENLFPHTPDDPPPRDVPILSRSERVAS